MERCYEACNIPMIPFCDLDTVSSMLYQTIPNAQLADCIFTITTFASRRACIFHTVNISIHLQVCKRNVRAVASLSKKKQTKRWSDEVWWSKIHRLCDVKANLLCSSRMDDANNLWFWLKRQRSCYYIFYANGEWAPASEVIKRTNALLPPLI